MVLQYYAGQNGWKINNTSFILAWLTLAVFFVLRDASVGVDTKYYCEAFTQFREIPWKEIFRADVFVTPEKTWTIDFEPGYRLMNKILSEFLKTPQSITVANGVLIFTFLYLFIKKCSPNPLMSLWLFVTLGVFQTDMNVTRNAIAIFICYWAFDYIRDGRWAAYILVVLLASLFHQTAILFLPLYFLFRYGKVTWRRVLILLSVSLVLGLNTALFRDQLMEILPARYARYFITETDNIAALLVGLFNLGVIGIAMVFLRGEERMDCLQSDWFSEGVWMMVLNLVFFAMSLGFFAWARVAALFGPYQIVFIPEIVHRCKETNRRKAATMLIGTICFLQYVARMSINNIGGSIPYLFFWQ